MKVKAAFLLAFCMIWWGCSSPTKSNEVTTTQPVLKLSVEAEPSSIIADGNSRMVIFTEFLSDDLPIADSTEIILLNTIGTLQLGKIYTHAGVGLDTLKSDTSASMGWVIAYALGMRDSIEIMFTARP
jgi:hypothetical protein